MYAQAIRPQSAPSLFTAIPDALKHEWARGDATLDQICPKVKHETAAVRNELIRLLANWSKSPKGSTL